VDELLSEKLNELEVQDAAVARKAIDAITGLWFDPSNDLSCALIGSPSGNRLLWRRHMVPAPSVTPWLVTDLHGRTFTIPDPVARPGHDRTIDFKFGTEKPIPFPLTVPHLPLPAARLQIFIRLTSS
jgi:hypothetical protein